MDPAPRALPERLLRGFVQIDSELLVERYRAALDAAGAPRTELRCFRVDAAGYSPEIAAELDDPHYLAGEALRSYGIVVSPKQSAAPLVHPGLGFAADVYRRICAEASQEIGALTLKEPLIIEAHHGSPPLTSPRQLADIDRFEINFRTPGGHIRSTHELEQMKRDFLASNRLWLDDAFIHEMARLAAKVRDVGPVPRSLVASKHPLGPFHTPAFGDTCVVQQPSTETTTILNGDIRRERPPQGNEARRARRVVTVPLDAEHAVALLLELEIAILDERKVREDPGSVEESRDWMALDHRLSGGSEDDPPAPCAELGEVARRVRGGGRSLELESLSPLAQLCLLVPTSRRPPIRAFVQHLQAVLDPTNLARAWRDAPDLCFARLARLPPAYCTSLVRWLETH